jgi:maltose alpha-D-glucosyltransferase/alpha-amylase
MFLRNNDELDLGRLSDDERRTVFRRFAPSKRMQLYDRGIRRRLAPMLGGDRALQELAFALLLALPGTPVLFYGDEIGMGDDLALPERLAVRTPMQWSEAPNAGFSAAPRSQLAQPVISRGAFAYRDVNVAAEQRDDDALLLFVQRAIRTRRRLRELKGTWEPLRVREPSVLALRYELDASPLVTLHNLGSTAIHVHGVRAQGLVDVFANRAYQPPRRAVELDAYGFRWLRDPAAA